MSTTRGEAHGDGVAGHGYVRFTRAGESVLDALADRLTAEAGRSGEAIGELLEWILGADVADLAAELTRTATEQRRGPEPDTPDEAVDAWSPGPDWKRPSNGPGRHQDAVSGTEPMSITHDAQAGAAGDHAAAPRMIANEAVTVPRVSSLSTKTDEDAELGCGNMLGTLPCVDHAPHAGRGRGSVHHAESGLPDRHDYGDDE